MITSRESNATATRKCVFFNHRQLLLLPSRPCSSPPYSMEGVAGAMMMLTFQCLLLLVVHSKNQYYHTYISMRTLTLGLVACFCDQEKFWTPLDFYKRLHWRRDRCSSNPEKIRSYRSNPEKIRFYDLIEEGWHSPIG